MEDFNEDDESHSPQHTIRNQLECDDPCLTHVMIGDLYVGRDSNPYWPPDGDWERDGCNIGYNNELTALSFVSYEIASVPIATLKKFFKGMADNRSIERLSFSGCFSEGRPLGKVYFDSLSQFFAHNHNLRDLHVRIWRRRCRGHCHGS